MDACNPPAHASTIRCIESHIFPGYILGLTQPSLAAKLDMSAVRNADKNARALIRALESHVEAARLAMIESALGTDSHTGLVGVLGAVVSTLQEAAGIPVDGLPRVTRINASKPKAHTKPPIGYRLVVPSFDPRAAWLALEWTLQAIGRVDSGSWEQVRESVEPLFERLQSYAPRGSNNIRFIQAAYAQGIPVMPLPGGIIQYGWGSRGRWFNSSVTDATPAIGVWLAKDKLEAAATLRVAGLPVPEGEAVQDVEGAVSLAERLGYPVVVKPADRDQGIGVYADLRDANAVRDAFSQARERSARIMLQRHVDGETFRITLFRGQCVGAVKRAPAGVTGDGSSTIRALIDRTNADPRRSARRYAVMKPIVIDDEAKRLLQRDGMDLTSVPALGRFVPLRRAANLATGGDVTVLSPGDIHPSYMSLARRAVTLLRLDVAAVEFITRDIGRPWSEAGAQVIEINAQPQMGSILTHLHGQLLQSSVAGDGSLISLLVMGGDPTAFVNAVRGRLAGDLPGLGCVSADGVHLGAETLVFGCESALLGARCLLMDPRLSALLLAVDHDRITREGLPLPFFHHLVLAEPGGTQPMRRLKQVLELIRGHLRGQIWLASTHPLRAEILRLFGQEGVRTFAPGEAMLAAILKTLRKAGAA